MTSLLNIEQKHGGYLKAFLKQFNEVGLQIEKFHLTSCLWHLWCLPHLPWAFYWRTQTDLFGWAPWACWQTHRSGKVRDDFKRLWLSKDKRILWSTGEDEKDDRTNRREMKMTTIKRMSLLSSTFPKLISSFRSGRRATSYRVHVLLELSPLATVL